MGVGAMGGAALCAQGLLDDQTLVDTLLGLVPRGEANARPFLAEDMARLEVCPSPPSCPGPAIRIKHM